MAEAFQKTSSWPRFGVVWRQGDAQAQVDVAAAYFKGIGVHQNYTEAVAWCRKAADQGSAAAQYWLGTMYEAGRGVDRDETQAISWYRKAADQGYADAKAALDRLAKAHPVP